MASVGAHRNADAAGHDNSLWHKRLGNRTGNERIGQDRTGQDETRQDSTVQYRTGQSTEHVTGRDRTGNKTGQTSRRGRF